MHLYFIFYMPYVDGEYIYGYAFRYRFPQASDTEDEQSADGDDAVGSAKDGNRKGDNWAPRGMIGRMVENISVSSHRSGCIGVNEAN